jgi:hypothetical protein
MMFKNRGDECHPLMNAEYGCSGMEGLMNTMRRYLAGELQLARQRFFCVPSIMVSPAKPIGTLEHELHVALCDNDPIAVRAAIEHGADPNAERSFGTTPLWFVTFHGRPESLAVLLECGATVPKHALEPMGHWEVLDWQVGDAEDALRYLPVAQALLERGADPNVKADRGKSLAEYWRWLPPLHRLFADAIARSRSTPTHPAT